MFDRSKRNNLVNKNPGPGFYFQNTQQYKPPETQADRYTFPRTQRVLMGDQTKPDYDMSVFYVDKGPGIKPKIGGYTISNTGGTDGAADPSKKHYPGVGNYETRHAYEKTTFNKRGPQYTVPEEGSYSIEACMQKASSSPTKPQKKRNNYSNRTSNVDLTVQFAQKN